MALTDREREILTFEQQWWKFAGSKEKAIRELFGITPARYHATLRRLVDDPDALAHDPLLIRRLRRVRDRTLGMSRHPAGRLRTVTP